MTQDRITAIRSVAFTKYNLFSEENQNEWFVQESLIHKSNEVQSHIFFFVM